MNMSEIDEKNTYSPYIDLKKSIKWNWVTCTCTTIRMLDQYERLIGLNREWSQSIVPEIAKAGPSTDILDDTF